MKDEKKHISKLPREDFVIHVVRDYYSDLKGLKNNDPIMKKVVKLDKRRTTNK